MSKITVEIPDNIDTEVGLDKINSIDIKDLFNKFGLDIDFIMQERKYQKEFLEDLKSNNFTISNSF